MEEKLCQSFQAFHSSYSDTGLLGIHFVTDKHCIEDMMHWCQNAWSVMTPGRTHLGTHTIATLCCVIFNYRTMHIFHLISSTFCSRQDEPVHHSDREWCSQRQERSEGQLGWTAQWYVMCQSCIHTNTYNHPTSQHTCLSFRNNTYLWWHRQTHPELRAAYSSGRVGCSDRCELTPS